MTGHQPHTGDGQIVTPPPGGGASRFRPLQIAHREDPTMSSNVPAPPPEPQHQRAEAQRWVRRLRVLYTILAIYVVLSLMWFAIDIADGTESLWFYWPMLGTGLVVAVTAIGLVGSADCSAPTGRTEKCSTTSASTNPATTHRVRSAAPTVRKSNRSFPQTARSVRPSSAAIVDRAAAVWTVSSHPPNSATEQPLGGDSTTARMRHVLARRDGGVRSTLLGLAGQRHGQTG